MSEVYAEFRAKIEEINVAVINAPLIYLTVRKLAFTKIN